tara:strand:- start:13112 stop:13381 length:270 start_codon:yes stop_codon:yes gene_type:complete
MKISVEISKRELRKKIMDELVYKNVVDRIDKEDIERALIISIQSELQKFNLKELLIQSIMKTLDRYRFRDLEKIRKEFGIDLRNLRKEK